MNCERADVAIARPKEMRMSFPTKPWEMPIFTPCDGYGRCYSETHGCLGWECKIGEICKWINDVTIRSRLEDLVSYMSDRLQKQRQINSDLDEKINGVSWSNSVYLPDDSRCNSVNAFIFELEEQVRLLWKLQEETREFVNYL